MMKEIFDFELLSLAFKYEIEPLKTLCTDQLLRQIKMENVVEYWEQFETFNGGIGSKRCENYIKENWDRILRSKRYEELVSNNVEAAIKLTLFTFGNDINTSNQQHLDLIHENDYQNINK